ncbi:hypothetical protein [Marilutibacter spongiae]|uniref:Uncharacterized protein n=1 Tax=Marilutibacter spongiae TaxID=2025720 RepID=A0A7W3Y623_9GAMM|nr:hypothetical protein [Lysobacter spongiae]MBB1060585.1 hypothetical protein [Lysobacter spongiae]
MTHRDLAPRIAAVLAGLALVLPIARADSWAPPRPSAVASEDGNLVARILPGERHGQAAQAQVFRYSAADDGYVRIRNIALRNPVLPLEILLDDDGTLVAIDNYGAMGSGEVLVVYPPDGEPRVHLDLATIVGEEALAETPHSVSSILWRCRPSRLSYDGQAVMLYAQPGLQIRVDLRDGSVVREASDC